MKPKADTYAHRALPYPAPMDRVVECAIATVREAARRKGVALHEVGSRVQIFTVEGGK